MSRVVGTQAFLIDLEPLTVRYDAVQTFSKQETLFVAVETDDGLSGLGYSYTIGTGGRAVLSMLREHLLPRLAGADARNIEAIWSDLFRATRATSVGALTSLALAAIDTALWDLRGKRTSEPLWRMAGGFRQAVPVYDTEGGWLHLPTEALVESAKAARDAGWSGVKIKVGKPRIAEDVERATAVREAIGADLDLMVDGNQAFAFSEALRLAEALRGLDIAWFEEPMPADDLAGHAALARATPIPLAVGESLYSIGQFHDYVHADAVSIIQVDVARIGGITPWLKVAHLAEAFNLKVAPHFLMELHVSLAGAVPNGLCVEHIPQLGPVTARPIVIDDGLAFAPDNIGLGIPWDWDAIDNRRVA